MPTSPHQPPQEQYQQAARPRLGPRRAPVQETVPVLDGVYMAKVGGVWLLCIAYGAQEYSHPHLRLIGGRKAGGYYFFDAAAVPAGQRPAFVLAIGDIPLRDRRAPAISLMRDFPDYHCIFECWANIAWQREAAARRAAPKPLDPTPSM